MHKSLYLSKSFIDTSKDIKELNIDSFMVQSSDVKGIENLLQRKASNQKVYAKVDVFGGHALAKLFPDALSVSYDEVPSTTSQYAGLCPTHPELRQHVLSSIANLIKSDIDGIWLSNMHYPTNWNLKEVVLLDTCYCPRCLAKFEEYIGEEVSGETLEDKFLHIDGSYYHEWLEFKADQVNSFIKSVREVIKDSGKDIKIGIFIVPWEDKDYGAGIKRIVAQDLGKLLDLVDIFSPMLFFQSLGKPITWVDDMLKYYWSLGINIWPSVKFIQTAGDDESDIKKAVAYIDASAEGMILGFPDDYISKDTVNTLLNFD